MKMMSRAEQKGWSIWILRSKVSVPYDGHFGFVVEARSAKEARKLAGIDGGSNNSDIWMDPKRSSCRRLCPTGKPSIVLDSFRAG